MTTLMVPKMEEEPWPSLGGQVCAWMEANLVFGPGDKRGERLVLSEERRFLIWRLYEVYPLGSLDPQGRLIEGRRRFKRGGISLGKGQAKTELGALITAVELHPEAPARTVAWGVGGDPTAPIGYGLTDPYIPMVAYTEDQTEELAYGALRVILENSSVAGDFDIGLERIMRLDGDGRAEALASSPNANDGARTTFQYFDETHRFVLPRLKAAHKTMLGNIPKRYAADAWSFETTTAFAPGEMSVAEGTMDLAREIDAGRVQSRSLFFMHRQASDKHDIATEDGARLAVLEALGPNAEWADVDGIMELWRDPQFERPYWERIYPNRPVQQSLKAFDLEKLKRLARPAYAIAKGANVTLGFDGSHSEDSTALHATEIETGFQQLVAVWEKPSGAAGKDWEVPLAEVDSAVEVAFKTWNVVRLYADPWGWQDTIAKWAKRWGTGKGGKVFEWDTRQWSRVGPALKNYTTAILTGELSHDGSEVYLRHMGNACRRAISLKDPDGQPMYAIQKERSDSPHKIDDAMAALLSWEARRDVIATGGVPEKPRPAVAVW